MDLTKICSKCKIEKCYYEFAKDKTRKDGLQNQCKSCKQQYKIKNKDHIKQLNKNYYENNKIEIIIKDKISRTINKILKLQFKEEVFCFKVLGYTPQQLIDHLMNHPDKEPWMNENNQGVYTKLKWDDNDPSTWVWHLDHIIPQSKLPYDSMDHPNFKKCWALENLRPLSAPQNLKEGNRR